MTLLLSFLGPARPYLIQYVLDVPLALGDAAGVRFWMAVVVALTLAQALVHYWQISWSHRLGESVTDDLRRQVFNHTLGLRSRFFDRMPVGALQTRVVSDVETLNALFSEGLISIFGELLQVFALLALMLYTDWRLTLVSLLPLPLLVLATYVFKLKVNAAFQRVRKAVAELNTFLQERLTGLSVVQIFDQERREYEKFKVINARHRDAHLDTVFYYSVFFPVVELIAALSTAALIAYGSGAVVEGRTTFGTLVAFIMYLTMLFRPIRILADRFNTLQLGLVGAERIFNLLDTREFIADGEEEYFPVVSPKIEFRDVRFAYVEGGREVLKGVSFVVEAGTTTAVVGATGSGKSTLVNLLMRFYEFEQGQILIDGRDIRRFKIECLRRATGWVMQDVFLFSGTILDNVRLFDSTMDETRVRRAAELIGADAFIERLPGKYRFEVGERGINLSTGQRQLVAFMRVLVHDPRILLLDEATANVDPESEAMIQRAIALALNGRTSIVVAHRLSTIQKADQILVMRGGEIVESGAHAQLLAMDGYYAKLYRLQYATAPLPSNE
ncbi:MAG: ABC transporter ATP-binding protein/permease [Bacteroidia bacterium]|nr:ABC transporter ATP-binding protein/permease [Bacteroidia bacterium]